MRVSILSAAGWRTPASFSSLATLALVSGCVAPRTVEAPPAPAPVARPAPAPRPMPLTADWRDWPYTPGTWTYRREPRGSLASFGTSPGAPVLTLRCDTAARQVVLSRTTSAVTPLTIRTSSVTRALPVQPAGGNPPSVAATLAANDGLLDAMGFSRGRFVIERPGAPALVVPAWAEIERVTEDCRG